MENRDSRHRHHSSPGLGPMKQSTRVCWPSTRINPCHSCAEGSSILIIVADDTSTSQTGLFFFVVVASSVASPFLHLCKVTFVHPLTLSSQLSAFAHRSHINGLQVDGIPLCHLVPLLNPFCRVLGCHFASREVHWHFHISSLSHTTFRQHPSTHVDKHHVSLQHPSFGSPFRGSTAGHFCTECRHLRRGQALSIECAVLLT